MVVLDFHFQSSLVTLGVPMVCELELCFMQRDYETRKWWMGSKLKRRAPRHSVSGYHAQILPTADT